MSTIRVIHINDSHYQAVDYPHRESGTPTHRSAQYPYTGQSDDWLIDRAWKIATFKTYDQRELIQPDRAIWIGERPSMDVSVSFEVNRHGNTVTVRDRHDH